MALYGIRRSTASRRVLAMMVAMAAQTANAQSTESGGDGAANSAKAASTNQDIIVTAQFRGQSVQNTPLSITAINSEMLEARGQSEVIQIAQQAPNVTLVQGGGIFGPSVGAQIRGVGQFDSNPAYEPGVGMYVDDVYIATLNGAVLDLLDLDRIEVLRGPQGTLTGRNSIGGAIKLFSRKPDGSTDGTVELAAGSRNRLSARASLGFKLTDNLSGRVAFVHKEQDGYVDQIDYGCARPGNPQGVAPRRNVGNCLIDKLGGENYSGARLALRYDADNVDWTVSGDYSNKDNTAPGEVLTYVDPRRIPAAFNCGRFCTYADFASSAGRPLLGTATPQLSVDLSAPNREKSRGWGVASNLTITLSDTLKLQSITAYRHYKTTFSSDDEYIPEPSAGSGLPIAPGLGFTINTHNFFSQELRLNGSIGPDIDWTIGGFYSDQKTTTYHIGEVGYFVPGLALQFYSDDPVKAKGKAGFATVIVRPVEGATITGGLRYTEEEKAYTFVRRNLDGSINTFLDPNSDINGFTSRFKGNRVDYRVSLDYRFSPAVLGYATVSTGFKGGGVTARPFNAAQARLGVFGPETLTAYEVGMKTDLFDRKLRLNLAGFINDYKNVQLQVQDCTNYGGGPICAVIANGGNARFKGVEAEISAHPVAGLDIDGSVSYIDAKWKRLSAAVVGDPVTRPNGVFPEDPVTSAPKWKASAGIQYGIDIGSSGSITPRVDYSYTGRRFQSRATFTPYYLPSYSMVNASLTWRNSQDNLAVTLEALNLFKAYYYTYRFDAIFLPTGTTFSTIGRPREFALKARYKF